mmetsp:Transcript_8654/g.14665  ORF Transcript_8654/g.14665 Transcript_8654/m.14665 type:complete len:80 (-) Transcript_8654:2572-2811(-)
MEPADEQNNHNRDSDLEAFQEKILAKCQVYRSAQKKDSTKLSEIRQELEADFALKSKDDISSAIEAHKQEIKSLTVVDE